MTAGAGGEINAGIAQENGSLADMKAGEAAVNGDRRVAGLDLGSATVNVAPDERSGDVGKEGEGEKGGTEGGAGDPEGVKRAESEIKVGNGGSHEKGEELSGKEEEEEDGVPELENGHGGQPESNVAADPKHSTEAEGEMRSEIVDGESGDRVGPELVTNGVEKKTEEMNDDIGAKNGSMVVIEEMEEVRNVGGEACDFVIVEKVVELVNADIDGQINGDSAAVEHITKAVINGKTKESDAVEVEPTEEVQPVVAPAEVEEKQGPEEIVGERQNAEDIVGESVPTESEEQIATAEHSAEHEITEEAKVEPCLEGGFEGGSPENSETTGTHDLSSGANLGSEVNGSESVENGELATVDHLEDSQLNGVSEVDDHAAKEVILEAEARNGELGAVDQEDSKLDGVSTIGDHAAKELSLEAEAEVCRKIDETTSKSADPVNANGSHGKNGDASSVGHISHDKPHEDTVEAGKDVAIDDAALAVDQVTLEAEVREQSIESPESVEGIPAEQSQSPKKEESDTVEGIEASTEPGEKAGVQVVKGPFFIVRIPRLVDEERQSQIQLAQSHLEEQTRSRDSIRDAWQAKKAIVQKHREKLDLAREEEAIPRDAFTAKRQEIDAAQAIMEKMKSATSVNNVNDQIRSMEHRMQHETNSLKKEKEFMNEIKRLKQHRDELSSNLCSQTELQEAFDQKDQIGERLKVLKKELDSLKAVLSHAESNRKAAHKIFAEERTLQEDLKNQFEQANSIRQEAYVKWTNLKREWHEKNEVFYKYKNDLNAAIQLASSGNREGLRSHCSAQVENIMTMWNNNDEFRRLYVKSNEVSTLRRLRTLDGRSLGPDEEPIKINSITNKFAGSNSLGSEISKTTTPVVPEKEQDISDQTASIAEKDILADSKAVQAKRLTTVKKSLKPTLRETMIAMVLDREEVEEVEKESKQAKEEEELAKREEELRKEKAAAELKERNRLEQKVKAREAEERKRRKAEKAQARAEYKAQKEAELREKKKAKKEKKKGTVVDETSEIIEETPTESAPEAAHEVDPTVAAPSRRSLKAPTVKKIQPLPLPLRNRGKRKMTTWMWVLLILTVVFALFLAGNYIYA